jgi:signal transduction histidine kinase
MTLVTVNTPAEVRAIPLAAIPFPAVCVDVSGRIMAANAAFNALRGTDRTDSSDTFDELLNVEDRAIARRTIFEVGTGPTDRAMCWRAKLAMDASAPERWVELYATAMDTSALCICLRPIDSQDEPAPAQADGLQRVRDRERGWRKRVREMERSLLVASHELQQPVNAIAGWAGLASTSPTNPATVDRALSAITRNARTLSSLVDDLRALAPYRRSTFRDAVDVDLRDMVDQALESLVPGAVAASIDLQRELPGAPVIVIGDPVRLQQVAINLATNAIQATAPGGWVKVSVEHRRETGAIVVRDSGRGIEPDLLPHVFEPFRRGPAARDSRQWGRGVGLSVVRDLVELHGGTVSASSGGAERGSVFVVELPLAQSRTPASPPAPEQNE